MLDEFVWIIDLLCVQGLGKYRIVLHFSISPVSVLASVNIFTSPLCKGLMIVVFFVLDFGMEKM